MVPSVEFQPLAAQAVRVVEALEMLGEPLPNATAVLAARSVEELQKALDAACLVGIHINPESRVKVQQGPARPDLVQLGWRSFLVKVQNEAGITAALQVRSPQAERHHGSPQNVINKAWLDLQQFTKQPMQERLSGLEVEYRILQLYSRDSGKREAKLSFDAGQGTQDLGFRNEVDILFTARAAIKVNFRVRDTDGKPATAMFEIRDSGGRVYPSQAKRTAPDLAFHPQIYRADGEDVYLPLGDFNILYTRGPEYRRKTMKLRVEDKPMTASFQLERWINPSKQGWYSGDHHIHASGCAHYEKPAEGVYPKDMMRHILGEDLKVGSVLSWGPGWYFQKTFFEGKDHKLSTDLHKMRYDVEVSGFPSSHTGHIVLLGVKEQDYPNAQRIEDWPSWGVPVFRWAKSQGAVTGFAHSGWGLQYKAEKLPTDEVPPFDGIGANEYIVGVTQNLVDFISTVDTPYLNELNIWYHTLNAGYRTRISGETDFPCIYGERVGLGRSYVRQKSADYGDWVQGLREGRNYVSDGKSHLIDFQVNGARMGDGASELKLDKPGKVTASVTVQALLNETPDEELRRRPYDQKPYWDIERARVGRSNNIKVELIVNGEAVKTVEVAADGRPHKLALEADIARSAWVAYRVLPSAHTNPVWVTVGGSPVRVKESLAWCVRAVEQCRQQKMPRIRLEERGEAERTYDAARKAYETRLAEAR